MAHTPVRTLALCLILAAAPCAACVQGVEVLDTEAEVAAGDLSRAAELWAGDPLRQSIDLQTGEYGRVIRDGELVNQNSQLGFGLPNPGFVEVGIQARETGILIDLGADADVAAALGTGSGFAGLSRRSKGRFGYGPADVLFDRLAEIEAGADGGAASRVVPVVGHVLVGAVVREPGSASAVDDALLVKILVVDHEPDRFLSIRWTVL